MKLDKFNEFFQNPELRIVLRGDTPDDQELHQQEMISNLFKVDNKIDLFSIFISSIEKGRAISKGTASQIIDKFTAQASTSGKEVQEMIAKILSEFPGSKFAEKMGKGVKKTDKKVHKAHKTSKKAGKGIEKEEKAELSAPPALPASHKIPLSQFTKKAAELRANDFKAAKAIQESSRDYIKNTLRLEKGKSFESTRAGRDIKDILIKANDVHLGEKRKYLLASCPKSHEQAGSLFDVGLKQKVSLFVSTLESKEVKSGCNNFWQNRNLSAMTLRDGWKIQNIKSALIAKTIEDGKRAPKLFESTLEATNGKETRTLTHLHYDGWVDHTVPNEQMLQHLLDRMDALQAGKETPIEINCKGGVGRTGTTVLSYDLRQQIRAQLAAGKTLDEVELDPIATLQAIRTQRHGVLGRPAQLACVYAVTGAFYERLKTAQTVETI